MKTTLFAIILMLSATAQSANVEFFNDEAALRCEIVEKDFDDFKEITLTPMTDENTRSLFIEGFTEPIAENCRQNSKLITCAWRGNQLRDYGMALKFNSAILAISPKTKKEVIAISGLITKSGTFGSRYKTDSLVTCYQDI